MGEIELKIDGQLGSMDLRALSDAIDHLDKLLRALGDSEDSSVVHLTDLSVGSAITKAQTSDQRTDSLTRGIDHLRSEATAPSGWSDHALDELLALHKASRRQGVTGVLLGATSSLRAIDDVLAANAESAKAATRESLGSVTGLLFRYNNRNSPEAGLADERTKSTVVLKFGNDLTSKVLSLMDQTVVVRGRLRRDSRTNAVRSVKVRDIEVKATPRPRTSVESGIGLLGRDWTDGMSSEEWVRRMRDSG